MKSNKRQMKKVERAAQNFLNVLRNTRNTSSSCLADMYLRSLQVQCILYRKQQERA